MADYRVVAHTQDEVGEGPVWIAEENALYWVDVLGPKLHRVALDSGTIESRDLPEPIGFAVPRGRRRGFIAGLQSGFHALTFAPFALERIGDPEPDLPGNRMNDGKADPLGRLWAGTMKMEADEPCGSLYRLDPDLAWQRMDAGYLVPNGPAFGPDPDLFYHADSPRGLVYRMRLTPDGLTKEPFIQFEPDWGFPDGMTVDSEGHLWIAHWDGGRISRFDPEGRLDRWIGLPASRVTSCAFGGPGLDRLFVTTAQMDRHDEPFAGALFEINPGVAGLPPCRFAG